MDEMIYQFLVGFPTFVLLIVIALSINFLGKGADLLVEEAVSISRRWGISQTIIGATIVSLGTTIPELTVSVVAALNGNPDIALGNAVGSIITNTSLILGTSAIIGHVGVSRNVINRQGRIQLFSAIFLVLVSQNFVANRVITNKLGLVFLAFLFIYTILTIKWSKDSDDEEEFEVNDKSIFLQLLILFGGTALVIISSKILLPSVEIVALRVGIPESIVAATLVALGTSLPEFVTSITAVRKGHGDLAVGNIVGANILNVLFVVGLSSFLSPNGLIVPEVFFKLHYPMMLLILVSFHIFAKAKDEEINRTNGFLLLAMYIAYLFFNYILV